MGTTKLFDNDGAPHAALLKILELFGLVHDSTPLGIKCATQDTWYKAGVFRAQISEQDGERRGTVLPYLVKLGMMHSVQAERLEHDYALVPGATVVAVRKRLAHLIMEWERGVRFKQVVLLGSTRALFPDKESTEVILKADNHELPFDKSWKLEGPLPKTEWGMMAVVYDQARFPWQQEVTVTWEATDNPRANTSDTLKTWIGHKPSPGSCLIVSSQPNVVFQGIVAKKILGPQFPVDAVGYEAPANAPVTTLLDALAKRIYEEAS